jgi:hypothetical protein
MSANVAILIVTYNSERQIGACIRSILAERDHVTQQIIVLDNDSKDGTVALIRKDFPEVELITPARNLGFAAGVNEAASHADADYLLLLNPDTEILDHAVDVIFDFAKSKPVYGLYGGRTLKADGRLEPSSCWGLPSLWSLSLFAFGITTMFPRNGLLDPESLGGWQRDTVREVGVITGCFLLVSKETWRKLNGFDERYFMYGEDVDLAIRARAAGYRAIICPDAKLRHDVGRSSATPAAKMLLLFRGKASLVRTHWSGAMREIGLTLLAAGVGLRAMSALLMGSKSAGNRWKTLWQTRKDWLQGYRAASSPAARDLSLCR